MNKVLYAKEGARSIMARTFDDFPWQVRVEVDGVEVEVPEVSSFMSLIHVLHNWILLEILHPQIPCCEEIHDSLPGLFYVLSIPLKALLWIGSCHF